MRYTFDEPLDYQSLRDWLFQNGQHSFFFLIENCPGPTSELSASWEDKIQFLEASFEKLLKLKVGDEISSRDVDNEATLLVTCILMMVRDQQVLDLTQTTYDVNNNRPGVARHLADHVRSDRFEVVWNVAQKFRAQKAIYLLGLFSEDNNNFDTRALLLQEVASRWALTEDENEMLMCWHFILQNFPLPRNPYLDPFLKVIKQVTNEDFSVTRLTKSFVHLVDVYKRRDKYIREHGNIPDYDTYRTQWLERVARVLVIAMARNLDIKEELLTSKFSSMIAEE